MSILQTIRVTEFIDNKLVGGTTRPLSVTGEDGRSYVLKLFSKSDAEQRSYTVTEVIANLLAKQFDLQVPEAVYMTIDQDLLSVVMDNQPNTNELLSQKAIDGPQFASVLHDGLPLYSPTNKDTHLELDEFESIFAFDMLISNDDRRKEKPNILRSANHYLLIDHEKAFEGLSVTADNFARGMLPHHYTNHLFYDRLRTEEKKRPNSVNFETFEEYFRILDISEIEENVTYLIQNGFNKDECEAWFNYLVEQKANYPTFVSLLKRKISE